MAVIYTDAADVGKDELAQLLGLDIEQEVESPTVGETARLLALADQVLGIQPYGAGTAAGEAGESSRCR